MRHSAPPVLPLLRSCTSKLFMAVGGSFPTFPPGPQAQKKTQNWAIRSFDASSLAGADLGEAMEWGSRVAPRSEGKGGGRRAIRTGSFPVFVSSVCHWVKSVTVT